MKAKLQLSQMKTEILVQRQKSSRKQLKYLKNHQTTLPPDIGRDNNTISSSISIRQCINGLNLYENQNVPLSQEVVLALRSYLNEVGNKKTHERRKWTSLHKSQKSLHKGMDHIFHSPYLPDGLMYKQYVFTQKQKENHEVYRKNLRKKKLNYENREINLLKQQENTKFKNAENIKQSISAMKSTIQTLKNQLNEFRETAKGTFIQLFNHVESSLRQIIEPQKRKNEQIHLLSLQHFKKYKMKEAEYEDTLQQEKQKLLRAKSCQKILKDYLQQRERELITIWGTVNSNSFSL